MCFTRPTQAKEDKSALSGMRKRPCEVKGSIEASADLVVSREHRAQKMGDFEMLVVRG